MLTFAFGLVCAAALFGAALAIRFLAGTGARPLPAALPPLHGAIGTAGFGVLILALRRGLPAGHFGTGGFGPIAAVLLGSALALGLAMAPAAWRRHRPAGTLVGTHAGLAIAGLVVLLALLALS